MVQKFHLNFGSREWKCNDWLICMVMNFRICFSVGNIYPIIVTSGPKIKKNIYFLFQILDVSSVFFEFELWCVWHEIWIGFTFNFDCTFLNWRQLYQACNHSIDDSSNYHNEFMNRFLGNPQELKLTVDKNLWYHSMIASHLSAEFSNEDDFNPHCGSSFDSLTTEIISEGSERNWLE